MKLISVIAIVFLLSSCQEINKPAFHEEIKVVGIKNPVISLDGTWKFSMNPPANFWRNEVSTDSWANIQVPGECAMQGFAIKHDIPYVYKTCFHVPKDYFKKIIKLKFDGVYSYARIWVNGAFIRDHHGGFTAWECDITNAVKAGESAFLTVEITDKKDEISYGSGYAKHQIGGILRSVYLMALPQNYLEFLYVETDLDANYNNARLIINSKTSTQKDAFLKIELIDPDGEMVILEDSKFSMDGNPDTILLNIRQPEKWDSEHPLLYTLVTNLLDDKEDITCSRSQKIGFREVEVTGNKLLVNGDIVKLRGACRHDIHPLLGRMTTPEYDKMDVLLAKEANMNFIRTSHYPPSEDFLRFCDEFGIYVEDETAVCFVNTHRTKDYQDVKQSGPGFTHQHLSQVEEMVHYHRNHPSVIIWSVGNENRFDINFKQVYDFVKQTDPTRPVMFSYPGTVPDSIQCYDILSMHYPSYQGNIGGQWGMKTQNFEYEKMPVLFDEWAHVACYNKPILQTDPNVRNFWGQSIDSMWSMLYDSKGGLGGAIWGYIDEAFMLPDTMSGFNIWWGKMDKDILPAMYEGPCVGYGQWGIIDTWRRKKPEFWNTKKAYSPIKILATNLDKFKSGSTLTIPVYNRFNHTNLNEIDVNWKFNENSGSFTGPDIAPRQKGEIKIPTNNWKQGDILLLEFVNDTSVLDAYEISFGKPEHTIPTCLSGDLNVSETSQSISISGKQFSLQIDKRSGLLENVIVGSDTIIKSGPYPHISVSGKYVYYSTIEMESLANEWSFKEMDYEVNDGIAAITTRGNYNDIQIAYTYLIDENGTIEIGYDITGLPADKKIQETGLKFIVGDHFDTIQWERDAYWTTYSENHPGAKRGSVNLDNNSVLIYREKPLHAWENDNKDFYYLGIDKTLSLTNNARSMRENIYQYTLISEKNNGINVYANGNKACRLNKIEGKYLLYINDAWDYTSLLWGNYYKNINLPVEYQGSVTLRVVM